jgi:predicted nucleic acid-binding Zn ribbon protein
MLTAVNRVECILNATNPSATRNSNENALRKVIGPVGVVFKGSGFYSTDHRSPSGMTSTSKSESSESSESSEVKTSTESKTTPEKKSKETKSSEKKE